MAITPVVQHQLVLGKDPTASQVTFYEKTPGFRGLSDRSLDFEQLEATLILGLFSGTINDRVLMFAPVAHEAWVLEGFNTVISTIFEQCKKSEKAMARAKGYQTLFSKIALTGRLLQLETEPPHWVSFGFSKEDPLPEWMPVKLWSK